MPTNNFNSKTLQRGGGGGRKKKKRDKLQNERNSRDSTIPIRRKK